MAKIKSVRVPGPVAEELERTAAWAGVDPETVVLAATAAYADLSGESRLGVVRDFWSQTFEASPSPRPTPRRRGPWATLAALAAGLMGKW